MFKCTRRTWLSDVCCFPQKPNRKWSLQVILSLSQISYSWSDPSVGSHCDPPLYMSASISQTSLFLKAAAAPLKSFTSRLCWDRTAGQNWDPHTKTGPWLSLIWAGTRVSRSANSATLSLRSFVRPLALHECVISAALVWWQLTTGKSRHRQRPPLWEPLVTWPLMRRPHMYHTRPNLDDAAPTLRCDR